MIKFFLVLFKTPFYFAYRIIRDGCFNFLKIEQASQKHFVNN